MIEPDIRWQQRFQNFLKAFSLLEEAVTLSTTRALTELEGQGLIQRFEFTHELAWNVLKDYFTYQGTNNIHRLKDVTREVFNKGLIEDGAGWTEMIKSRNQSSHTYNEETVKAILTQVVELYYPLFLAFKNKMNTFFIQ